MKTIYVILAAIFILACTKDEDVQPIETIKKVHWKITCTAQQATDFTSPQFMDGRPRNFGEYYTANIYEVNEKVSVRLKKTRDWNNNKKMTIKIELTTTYSTGRITYKADSTFGIQQYCSMYMNAN